MKNLLRKELSLVIMKPMYLFALMPLMLLIPAYPYMVGMGYVMLAVFVLFNVAALNKDHEFTACLPVRRADIVLAKQLTVLFLEGITLAAAIPCALIGSRVLNTAGNPVGMDANFAFFGFTMLEYAAFNAIFLPLYFRTGYKSGIPALLGAVGYTVLGVALELFVQFVPGMRVLDTLNPADFGYQLIALAVGAAVLIGTAVPVRRLAVKTFERVNL